MESIEGINIRKRVSGLTEEMRKLLADVDPATIGHYTEFGFMHPRIHAMYDREKVIGNAITVRIPPQESQAVYVALDSAQPGDVLVIDRCHDQVHACVGEVVALTASVRKVAAIIVDGPITDFEQIEKIGIPVFSTGISNLTTKFLGAGGEVNMDISCGGVVVHPGDTILADKNGILVLRQFEIQTFAEVALEDQKSEVALRKRVTDGLKSREIFGMEDLS